MPNPTSSSAISPSHAFASSSADPLGVTPADDTPVPPSATRSQGERTSVVGSGANMALPLIKAFEENREAMARKITKAIENISDSRTPHLPSFSLFDAVHRALVQTCHSHPQKIPTLALARLEQAKEGGHRIAAAEALDAFVGTMISESKSWFSNDQWAKQLNEPMERIAQLRLAAQDLKAKAQSGRSIEDRINEITAAIKKISIPPEPPSVHDSVSAHIEKCQSSRETLDIALSCLQAAEGGQKVSTIAALDKFLGILILENTEQLSDDQWAERLGGVDTARINALKTAASSLKGDSFVKDAISLAKTMSDIQDTLRAITGGLTYRMDMLGQKIIETFHPGKKAFETAASRLNKFAQTGRKLPLPIAGEMFIGTLILERNDKLTHSNWGALLEKTDEQIKLYKLAGLRLKNEVEGVKREDLHIAVSRKLAMLFPLHDEAEYSSLESAVKEMTGNPDRITRDHIISALHYLQITQEQKAPNTGSEWEDSLVIYSSADEVESLFANALLLSIGTDDFSARDSLYQAAGIHSAGGRVIRSNDQMKLWKAFQENRYVSPEELGEQEDDLTALYSGSYDRTPSPPPHDPPQEDSSAAGTNKGKRVDRSNAEDEKGMPELKRSKTT